MLSKFSVRKPYTIVVAVILVFILGFVSFDEMTVDLLPSMNLPYALVMTTYPGASPEEVETTVTKPVEQAMSTISNIKNVSSSSMENASTVILEFEQTANMDAATIEMRESLDQISSYWPDTVGNPIIMKLNPNMLPVMISAVSISGKDPLETTRIIQEEVLPEIESLEGVASVSTYGEIEQTIRVTVKEAGVSSVDERVKSRLDEQFAEADQALADARAEVENGKAQLESGKNAASGQFAGALQEISRGEAEIEQGRREIQERRSQIDLARAELESSAASLDASEQLLNQQKEELAALYARKDQMEQEYQTVLQMIQMQGETEELLLAKNQLQQSLALLEQYDTSMQTIESGLSEIAVGRQTIAEKQEELAAGMQMIEQTESQLDAGVLSLADARAQLNAAQLTTALEMSSASVKLETGEAEIRQREEELKTAKEAAAAEADMKALLTASTIQGMLTAQNFNMPAGYVTEDGIDYLVRVGDKFSSLDDLRNLVLVDIEGITPIKLSDVADVELTDNAGESYARLNGENGILLQIQKQTGYSTGEVTDRILERFKALQKEDGELEVVALMDQGIYIDLVISSVLENLLFGALLAILILLLFLRDIRPTFVIACSIPISILTAIVLMYFSGVTMNVISLSGLALGVGMLVDNSIVVIENIYRMRNEEHVPVKTAAIEGARQVAGAIAASTLTTVCVFLPIVFTEGIARQLFVDMGLTIAYSLLASLIVALSVVPMLSSGMLVREQKKEGRFFIAVKNGYEKLLRRALRGKVLVLLGALALFIASCVLEFSRGAEFMPAMQSTEISMTVQTPEGTEMKETAAAADAFAAEVLELADVQDIGGMSAGDNLMGGGSRTNEVSFYALLEEERTMTDEQLQEKLEDAAARQKLEISVSMSNMDMSTLGGSGISIQIKGRDLDTLQQIAGDVAEIVSSVEGAENVSDGMQEMTEEMRIIVEKEKAAAHNLTVAQVYQSLSAKLQEAPSMTNLDMGASEVEIVVEEQKNQDLTREDIKNLTLDITGQDGKTQQIKLKEIASFVPGKSPQSISRDAQSRYMTVSAEVAQGDNIGLVSERIQRRLADYQMPEGYTLEMQGEDESIRETMAELFKMLALAVVFMYLIMVAQFQSLLSPFIVMFTVPLAFTGGMLALLVSGSPISVIAMIGFVVLSGVIVNNGIVFIDYTNQLVEAGIKIEDAIVKAGRTRLRPIIMTALTTILGLSTMAAGNGQGSEMVQPMAVVTIGGLLYGTILTLFVVPCIYEVFHGRKLRKEKKGTEGETVYEEGSL